MRASAKIPVRLRLCVLAFLAAWTAWSCQIVDVTAIPVASVAVVPTVTNATVGEVRQLRAVPKGTEGQTLTGRSMSWNVGDPSVARVDSTGRVEAVGPGGTVVRARSGDAVGEAWIEVEAAPPDDAPGADGAAGGEDDEEDDDGKDDDGTDDGKDKGKDDGKKGDRGRSNGDGDS